MGAQCAQSHILNPVKIKVWCSIKIKYPASNPSAKQKILSADGNILSVNQPPFFCMIHASIFNAICRNFYSKKLASCKIWNHDMWAPCYTVWTTRKLVTLQQNTPKLLVIIIHKKPHLFLISESPFLLWLMWPNTLQFQLQVSVALQESNMHYANTQFAWSSRFPMD